MMIKIDNPVPSVPLKTLTLTGVETVDLRLLSQGKRIVFFAVPGAFTPICSQIHVPSFVEHSKDFKEKGVDLIACVSVNDPFVMKAWQDQMHAQDILMLSDPTGDFTRAMDLGITLDEPGLGYRSRRYAALVENGILKALEIEPEAGCTLTHAASFIQKVA